MVSADYLWPYDAKLRIIPGHAAFVARTIEVRAFIAEFGDIAEHKKSMREALRNIELFMVFLGKFNSVPFAVGFAVFAQIHSHVKDRTADNTYQFSLRMLFLIMKAAQDAFYGTGLVILTNSMVSPASFISF